MARLRDRTDDVALFAEPVPERVIGCNRAIGAFAGMPIFVPGWYAQTDRITGWLQSRAHVLAPSLNIDGEPFLVANKSRSSF